MGDTVYISFPKALYDLIVARSGGRLDPEQLAAEQVEYFVDRNRDDASFWSEAGLAAFKRETDPDRASQVGDPDKGYQWQRVFLPNGTELRMTYKGRNAYAQVQHERVMTDGVAYSPSQWAGIVAGHTSRNAWRDIWVRFPGEKNWTLADNLRSPVAELVRHSLDSGAAR